MASLRLSWCAIGRDGKTSAARYCRCLWQALRLAHMVRLVCSTLCGRCLLFIDCAIDLIIGDSHFCCSSISILGSIVLLMRQVERVEDGDWPGGNLISASPLSWPRLQVQHSRRHLTRRLLRAPQLTVLLTSVAE